MGLVERLEGAVSAELALGTSVVRLVESENDVKIFVRATSGAQAELAARVVIVATPATAARALVEHPAPAVGAFLESVRYARYTVVAFELEGATLEPDFRFVVTPDLELSLVMHQASVDRRRHVFYVYFAEDACVRHADALDDRALVESARRGVARLGVSGLDVTMATSHVKRWALSGTVLGADYQRLKRDASSRATRRLFLAGDYLAPPPGWGYGLDDAVTSGRATAELVEQALRGEL